MLVIVLLDKGEASPVKEYQFKVYEGIGGAFNEIGGEVFLSLVADKQESLMSKLFGNENARFSFCRTTVGASEVPEDFKMDKLY